MTNEAVSTLKVSGVHPTLVRMFVLAGAGIIAPQPGISLCQLGDKYVITKRLEMGGLQKMVLEIVNGVLQPAGN